MKNIRSHFLLVLLSPLCLLASAPTHDPVESFYGSGVYDWSGDIQWTQVVDITDHGGAGDGTTPNDAAFVSARDALVASGGGVLYFPTGTYVFNDSIGLADNVVLRGDVPVVASAMDPDYRPPSKLVFPQFIFDKTANGGTGNDPDDAFKGIGMLSGQTGINTGLVDLDINRASVFAGGYGTGSENVVIFGVRSNNVASEQPWTVPTPEQEPWQIHPNRFVSNISAFAYRNVLVANCMVNDKHYWIHRQDDGKDLTGAPGDLATLQIDDFEQPGYLVDDRNGQWRSVEDIFGGSVPGAIYTFEYTNHYGINVQGSTGEWGAPPWVQPNLFYSGAVIRDNWIYCTMRVKIDASGRGLVVRDNVLKDRSGKRYFVDPNGDRTVQNAATLENRGIDWRGHDVLIEGNDIEVSRHLLGTGSYSSVDGEGILHQEVHGSTIDNVIIRGNTANAYIGIWKMPYTRNVLIEDNTLTGAGYIYVQSDTNGRPYPMYNVIVQNNDVGSNGIRINADYYSPGVLSADVRNNIFDGTLAIEDHAIYSGNTKQDGVSPIDVDIRTGAVAIDPPVEGILYADKDPDDVLAGETVTFTVLTTTPSSTVERVNFYRHKTLMGTDDTPPYTFQWNADGARALWSAEIEQPEQSGGFDPYTALLLDPGPAFTSPPAVVLTAPGPGGSYVAPTDLALAADVTPGSAAIDRVEFYSGGTFLGADADQTAPFSYTWMGVPRGTYSLTAKVWDTDGAAVVSDPVIITVEGPPDVAPQNVTAIPLSDTEILLSWENLADNAEEIEIERSPAGAGTWSLITTIDAALDGYTDSGLTPGEGYDYRLTAVNVHGSGPVSGIASATTFASASEAPGAPSAFVASALNDDRILLSWNAASGDVFGYTIAYRVSANDPWTQLAQLSAGETTYRHIGLRAGDAFLYRIHAWNNVGDSSSVMTSGATLVSAFSDTFSSTGDPWPIPGRIEFEDYNPGGFYDTSDGNEGSSDYRSPDPVDIGGGGTGRTIGWIDNGEWLEFSVHVSSAGLYTIDVAFASPNNGSSVSLKLDGENMAPPFMLANTGGWGDYQLHTVTGVYLPAGHHLLRAYVENDGFNLDYVQFTLTDPVTYAIWQQAMLSGVPDSGAGDNPDKDPYTNQFEMLMGTDPLKANSFEPTASMNRGVGTLVFPITKGVEGMSWAIHYSDDLGISSGWGTVPAGQMRVIAEESGRIWYQADVSPGAGNLVFFQVGILP